MRTDSEYLLKCDEPVYRLAVYNQKMEVVERNTIGGTGRLEARRYYWIEAENRDDVLVVEDFMTGEDAITGLESGEYNRFEDVVEDMSDRVEIREQRPPV